MNTTAPLPSFYISPTANPIIIILFCNSLAEHRVVKVLKTIMRNETLQRFRAGRR